MSELVQVCSGRTDTCWLSVFSAVYAISATRLKYGGLFDTSTGVRGLMAAAYTPELAVSIGSYMYICMICCMIWRADLGWSATHQHWPLAR
jgi:hypothetical protein